MWIKRTIEDIWAPETGQPISVLVGPRQSGKSSFLDRSSGPQRRHVTFDDLSTREAARANPRLFLDALGTELVIDEAQYVPELFPELKLRVDALKRALRDGEGPNTLSVWLTGSNRLLLDREIAESLTGRASYFLFHPLSLGELAAAFGNVDLATILFKGGWPELYTNRLLNPVAYLNDHIQTTLEKDLVRTAGIEKVSEFLRVLRLLAGRIGGLFVASELARDAGVRSGTVSEWMSFVARMMYIVEVPAFTSARLTRLIKAPKYFFLDPGIATRLQGWPSPEPLLVSPQVGGHFENLVVSEVIKLRDVHQKSWEVMHWRTKDGEEVDLVISDGRHHVALECKVSAREAARAVRPRSLKALGDIPYLAVSFDRAEPAQGDVQAIAIADLSRRLLEILE
jgi:predicted AAA+ superfamily ATPase